MVNWIVRFLAVGFVILAARLPEKQNLVLQHASLEPAYEPFAEVQLIPPTLQEDLDLDGLPDCLALKDGKAVIHGSACSSPAAVVWESPEAWNITHAAIGDLNRNGIPEAVLLVWRLFKPWPVDRFMVHNGRIDTHQDKAGESCHIILIEYEKRTGQFEESWAGSALARPLNDFRVIDLDGDSLQELAVLETRYDALAGISDNVSVWEWSGFGFQLVTRKEGRFFSLNAGSVGDGPPVVLVVGNLKEGNK